MVVGALRGVGRSGTLLLLWWAEYSDVVCVVEHRFGVEKSCVTKRTEWLIVCASYGSKQQTGYM